MDPIHTAVAAVRQRDGIARALRAGGVGLGVLAVAVGLGVHPLWALLVLAASTAGFHTRIAPVEAARWLDAAGQRDGAIECAWDNRAQATPHAIAQRARAGAAVSTARPALGMPAGIALVGAALWAWPLSQSSVLTAPSAPIATGAGDDPASPGPAAPTEAADAGRSRTAAKASPPPTPDGGATADGGPGGEATSVAQVGGVGRNAGDQAGDPAGVRSARPEHGGPTEALPVGAGAIPTTAKRAGVVPPGPIPAGMDDVADPARAYPRRHRAVVTAWFDRKEGR